jgi:hypothetical protein
MFHTVEPTPVPQPLADDLLRGADEIAEFIFGERGKARRKVYYLAESSHLPVFRLGSLLCARRSVLLRWIAGQESKVRPPRGCSVHSHSSPPPKTDRSDM